MEATAVAALLDDAVIGTRHDQQRDRDDHQPEPRAVEVARIGRHPLEALAEGAAQLETEQDLRPEDQHPGLVEGQLCLSRKVHPGASVMRSVCQ